MAHSHTRSCGPKCGGGSPQEIWLPPRAEVDRSRSVAARADETSVQVDLLDSDILKIEDVWKRLTAKYGGQIRSYDDFQREAIERYHEIGFRVDVEWRTSVDQFGRDTGYRVPIISILSRIEPQPFDHERQQWEVQQDILGIDDNPGVINPATGQVNSAPKSVGFVSKG